MIPRKILVMHVRVCAITCPYVGGAYSLVSIESHCDVLDTRNIVMGVGVVDVHDTNMGFKPPCHFVIVHMKPSYALSS